MAETTNYGLKGGTLDNTKHLEAGARATLKGTEFIHWFENRGTRALVAQAPQDLKSRQAYN